MDLRKLPDLDLTNAPLLIISQSLLFAAIRKTGVTNGMPASDHEAFL